MKVGDDENGFFGHGIVAKKRIEPVSGFFSVDATVVGIFSVGGIQRIKVSLGQSGVAEAADELAVKRAEILLFG